MKRFWAAVIDVVICYILSSILFGCVWGIFKQVYGSDLHTISRMTVRGLKFVISFLTYFSYSVLFDSLSQGNTLGRDMTGYLGLVEKTIISILQKKEKNHMLGKNYF